MKNKNNLLGNNDYGDKNIFIYNNSNNTNNNHHLKNNFSEYENIITRNNLLELGINHKYNSNIKNYVNNFYALCQLCALIDFINDYRQFTIDFIVI